MPPCSPNYPSNYDAHSDCEWLLGVDVNHVVKLQFLDFDVEPHTNCSYDSVRLYDGNSTAAPLLLTHCGPELPQPAVVLSSGHQVLAVHPAHISLWPADAGPAEGGRVGGEQGVPGQLQPGLRGAAGHRGFRRAPVPGIPACNALHFTLPCSVLLYSRGLARGAVTGR